MSRLRAAGWVVGVAGLMVVGVAGCGSIAEAATVSGANGDIVYVVRGDVPLIVVRSANGAVNALAVAGLNGEPEWSPGGAKLAYEATAVGMPWTDHIWVMDADGANPRDVTSGHATDTQWQPSWSPDGTKIAFSASSDEGCSHNDIWIMNADGTAAANITNTPDCGDYDSSPEWSPDGQRIAFESGRNGQPELLSMRVDGSDVRVLAEGGRSPSYSPDGAMIVFTRSCDLWIVNKDGGPELQLTSFRDVGWCAGGPDWSPDGTEIAFGLGPLDRWNEAELYTIGADGIGLLQLTSNLAQETFPDWRPMSSAPQPPAATVGLVDPATGEWHLRNWTGTANTFYYGNPGDYPFVGDWNCDGTDTPGLYRQSDGYAYLRNSNTQGVADTTFFFGDPGDVPLAGDFNGDGCDTLSIYRPSEARFYIINELGRDGGGLGAADYSFLFGDSGDKPVVGDWDGDGVDEIGLHREATGFFYYRNTLTTGVADGQFYFGDPGDRFVAGEWGIIDGRDTPAVFRPSDLTFYFRHTLTQGNADAQFTWGASGPGWIPVAGQFKLGLAP